MKLKWRSFLKCKLTLFFFSNMSLVVPTMPWPQYLKRNWLSSELKRNSLSKPRKKLQTSRNSCNIWGNVLKNCDKERCVTLSLATNLANQFVLSSQCLRKKTWSRCLSWLRVKVSRSQQTPKGQRWYSIMCMWELVCRQLNQALGLSLQWSVDRKIRSVNKILIILAWYTT